MHYTPSIIPCDRSDHHLADLFYFSYYFINVLNIKSKACRFTSSIPFKFSYDQREPTQANAECQTHVSHFISFLFICALSSNSMEAQPLAANISPMKPSPRPLKRPHNMKAFMTFLVYVFIIYIFIFSLNLRRADIPSDLHLT